MAAPATNDELLDLIRRSGVVDDKRLDAYLTKLRATAGAMPEEPGKLAGVLVRDGVLTHFQAEQFLQGKWRRFTIGKYKVLEKLGSGGMGSVYLCEHKFMRRRAAVKVLPTSKADDPAALERFYREARAVAALDHPNIVRAYDIDQDEKLHFLVMEYVDGSSLQELIKKFGPMDPLRAAHYTRQAAIGLEHAHQMAGLVHRDIKPGNVLVDRTGQVKILDMGLARFFHDEDDILTKKYDETVLGTADYLAPEQALDSHSVDIRADIYSLGATFYYMLTASTPFSEGTVAQKLIWHQTRQPKPVRSIRPDVPAGLAAIIDKMMSKDPRQRYQTPAEVVEALTPWTQEPIPPPTDREMPHLSPAAMGSVDFGAMGPVTGTPRSPAPAPFRPTGPTPLPPTLRPQTSPSPKPKSHPQASAGAGPVVQPKPMTRVTAAPAAPPPAPAGTGANGRAVTALSPKPEEEEAGPLPWDRPESQTEDLTAQLDTAPDPPPTPARSLHTVQKQRRFWAIVTASAIGLFFIVAVVLWATFGTQREPDKKNQPAGAALLQVTSSGEAGTFKTVREALKAAKRGDTIRVTEPKIEEQLLLQEGQGREVTIEAAAGDQPVVWTCPEKKDELIRVNSVPELKLKGFVFDGLGRVDDLVKVSGRCPGLTLENVHLQGFKRCAVAVWNCTGESPKTAVTLKRVRTTTAKEAEAAVIFRARSGVNPPNDQFFAISDCRFEGPYKAAIQILAPVYEVTFARNRFYKAGDGVFYEETIPRHPIRLTLESNTFADVQRGLHFAALPAPDAKNQVVVKDNLFFHTGQLFQADHPVGDVERKVFRVEGNVRDPASGDGNLGLPTAALTFSLPLDPPDDATFLRYPKGDALAQAGSGKTPVGVPPE